MEHITTRQAAEYVQANASSGRLAATVTPQHILLNRNALFLGGLRPHAFCLPILKREEHRSAVLEAVTSGILPRHRLGAAPEKGQGVGLRLRRDLQRARGPGPVRDGVRPGGQAGQAGGVCLPQRPRLLRAAPE